MPSINSRNGGMRISANNAGPCRATEPDAILGYVGRLHETFSHGGSRALGMQKSVTAVASHHRRELEVLF